MAPNIEPESAHPVHCSEMIFSVRADLIALLLLLQSRKMTASQVAAENEICQLLPGRDLEAPLDGGNPGLLTAGRGGGWRLVGGAELI